MEKKRFKELFPKLAKEMESGDSLTDISFNQRRNEEKDKWSGYQPNEIDFIRRCSTEEEAFEIIDYLEGREEITSKYATELKKLIKEKGLRSLGSKKETGFYDKNNPR
jgi:hypothetical protein